MTPNVPDANLTATQKRAVSALLSCRSIQEASDKARVSRRTVHRWLRDPEFVRALESASHDLLESTTRRLVNMTTKSLDALEGVLDDASKPDGVRVRAAVSILNAVLAVRELTQLERELSVHESRANQIAGQQT